MMTAEEADRLANELVVCGAVFATLALGPRPTEVVRIVDDEQVAALVVRFPFMRSAYRLTITMEPGTDRDGPG